MNYTLSYIGIGQASFYQILKNNKNNCITYGD